MKKILKFYTRTCLPCKQLSDIIGKVDLGCELVEIDLTDDKTPAQKYGIRAVPTLVLLGEDGIEVKRKSGMIATASELEGWVT